MTKDEALKLALAVLKSLPGFRADIDDAIDVIKEALAQPAQEPVTILSDGSAFGVMSFPLPDDHWLYAPNEYRDGEYEPIDLPKPILTHALSESVVAAVRYAVRGATMRGQETDFDPDALVQNAVYALCGPYTTPKENKRIHLSKEAAELVNKYGSDQAHLILKTGTSIKERDEELAAEAEAYADYNFKGEVYWREAYESKLIDLIRADEREACAKVCDDMEEKAEGTECCEWPTPADCAANIRARGNT